MAKSRKAKNDEQRQDSSAAVVRHQKLCLSIDMKNRRIFGWTELKVVVPETGLVGLHAGNMNFQSVRVDGEAAEYDYFSLHPRSEDENRWASVSCPNSAADAAASAYMTSLAEEVVPNLIVFCGHGAKPANGQPLQPSSGANGHVVHENVKVVRVEYWIETAESGIHFRENVLHTNNQIGRARCWFPCVDSSLQRCCYDLEFTVDSNFVVVSNGTLLYQVMTKDDPPRKTYVYKLTVPVSAGWISVAVAPFEVFPDRSSNVLSHICLSSSLPKLRNTVGFFHSAFSHYEDYLSASFPFGSYKQVFISPEMVISSMSLGASMCIFSSQLLFDEKVIDQIIDTRIKLAYALAKQWFGVFITAETSNDEWLVDGLAGFLTDSFIKRFLGNNEARYQRYKANYTVFKADVTGASALSLNTASSDLYGTQSLGFYGKIRTRKAVAILQMLEKQMGPESFCKILQIIVSRAHDHSRSLRTISTKEFRQFANKIGNLERPFLKEFFPRWVGSCGCPVLRMAFSYNKRRNMIELAVWRGCTATAESMVPVCNGSPTAETREEAVGWPGMMSIRVHELDGMYDHPSLPMTGDACQLLEIQCHSKLAAKRVQKPKKGSRPDGSDDNGDAVLPMETRSGAESPLLWVRVDPEMEYLAEINFHQPVQMWINQLEKDKDVVAQSQAIAALETLAHCSFSVVNALNNFLCDSKAFWRVRIEAAFALATTASEESDGAGLQYLVSFYKKRRFDAAIGLPRPNDFHDFPEYFVLEAIPLAVAMVRTTDQKSPQEAVEFILQMLKYNDNHGNPYSDVYWLSLLVQSVGELEFGHQSMQLLSSLLKRIERLLLFDRLMPSYNGILTISCIRTLTQIALKLSPCLPLVRVSDLLRPFRSFDTAPWQVRMEASRALLELEFYCKGVDASLTLFLIFLDEEPSLRGQVKLAAHMMHLCQTKEGCGVSTPVNGPTLVRLLCLLDSLKAFNNVLLRHDLFCILQILAQRPPTLYGVPKAQVPFATDLETSSNLKMRSSSLKLRMPSLPQEPSVADTPQDLVPSGLSDVNEPAKEKPQSPKENLEIVKVNSEFGKENSGASKGNAEASRENTDTISNGNERRISVVKIRLKQSAASSRVEEVDNNNVMELSCARHEGEVGPSSFVSVDAPPRLTQEPTSTSHQNIVEIHSSGFYGSSMRDEEVNKELQCTADSKDRALPEILVISPRTMTSVRDTDVQDNSCVEPMIIGSIDGYKNTVDMEGQRKEERKGKHKEEKKKHKDKKRKREEKKDAEGGKDDVEYLERKRLKKQRKKEEKERAKEKAKLQCGGAVTLLDPLNQDRDVERKGKGFMAVALDLVEPVKPKEAKGGPEGRVEAVEGSSSTQSKLRIKFKSRTIGNI